MNRILLSLFLLGTIGVLTPWAALGDDRKDRLQDSSKKAKDGNQQQLQPNMIQHQSRAKEHLEEAEKAREKKDYGKAEREEKLAMMEQMKAQQLQQQMQANNDSAQKNDDGAQKLTQDDGPTGKQIKGRDAAVVDLRVSEMPSKFQGQLPEAPAPAPVKEAPPIAPQELANLSEVPAPPVGKLKSNAESTGSVEAALGAVTQGGVNLGFDDSAKGEGKTPTPTQTVSSGSASAGFSVSAGAVGGGSPSASSSGGAGADFWGNVGKMVDEDNKKLTEKETRLSLKKLRGDKKAKRGEKMPGAELDDEAFWKKVGSIPAQCGAATGGARSQCLHVARQEIEFRWAESQRLPASKAVELRKASF